MTKKLKYILLACVVCSLLLTSCVEENTDISAKESTIISSSENIQTEEITPTNTTVTETTTAITTEQEQTYDDFSTCAGTLTYALCEKAAAYCKENMILPIKVTICDYNFDNKADICINGAYGGYYNGSAVISDGFDSFYYIDCFDFMPGLYQNNITGEKAYIAVTGHWFSSDTYSMGVYSINGNDVTVPYAAVPIVGYIGGGFTQFGFMVTENVTKEDFEYITWEYEFPDESNYTSLFYSGMGFGDCYAFMQNYTRCEEAPQLTVESPYKFPGGYDNISNTKSVAQEFYRMFLNPIPVEADKIDGGFSTQKGNIICVNEVKDTDNAKYENSDGSIINISLKVCKNAADFIHKNITDEYDAVAAPCDVDNDGKAEMLVGLYQGKIKNAEDTADIYCIYENGTIEKKSDYKLHWGTIIINYDEYARGIEVSFIFSKNTTNEYDAQELYLLFTNYVK